MVSPKVAIIGAGPGGLGLACILQARGWSDFTVYEADALPEARNQGGSLDLKADSGQVALKAAGLRDEFLRLSRKGGEDMRILDKTGKVLWDEVHGENDYSYHPEIDRGDLTKMFLRALNPGTVQWGHKLLSIRLLSDGENEDKLKLCFANNLEVESDLVIGADGAWSKVRQSCLSLEMPIYTGISFVDLVISDYTRLYPEMAKLVGRGSMFALQPHQGIIAQVNSNDKLRVYAAIEVDEKWHKESDVAKADPDEQIRLLSTKYFPGWNNSLLELLERADKESTTIRPIYALPVGFTWPSKPNATLLGDAAHLMSPFAGEGVNLALADALTLADALDSVRSSKSSLPLAIGRYEKIMQQRSQGAAKESADNLKQFFSEDSPESVVRLFRLFWPLMRALSAVHWVHGYVRWAFGYGK